MDTHAFLWHLTNDKRLGAKAKEKLELIDRNQAKALVPAIVIAEAIFIIEKKKVKGINFIDIMKRIYNSPNYIIIDLNWEILERLATSTNIPEIHDRIIVVTAELFNVTILSKDSTITERYREVIW